jgi:hypothetical protein
VLINKNCLSKYLCANQTRKNTHQNYEVYYIIDVVLQMNTTALALYLVSALILIPLQSDERDVAGEGENKVRVMQPARHKWRDICIPSKTTTAKELFVS